MFNKVLKKSVLWITVITVVFSSSFSLVYSQNTETEEVTLSDRIEGIIKNLSILVRYEEIDEKTLYKAAFEEVFQNDPALYENVMKAIVSSIDENSEYFNQKEAEAFLQELNDEVTGIGVNVFFSDGSIIVSEPIPGSPAERVGIKAGDIIIGADSLDLRGMSFEAALEKIRGKEGTIVKIKIIRSGISEPLSFNIKREKVVVEPVDYEILENNGKKIGKIKIYSFTETCAKKFGEALDKISKQGIKNIIIDVRDNGGGYLSQAVEIADMFLPKDAVITTEEHKISLFNKVYKASGKGKKYNVVILVNEMSASASEVLTAALCENEVAKSIGVKTYGKGTVQSMNPSYDGAIIKYTSAFYLTPMGNNIHKIGISPDVKLENSAEPVDMTNFEMFSLSKTYRTGDKGAEVEKAKRMLKEMGIFIGEVNDVYDENLRIAVTNFQKMGGLFPYGVLDITTQLKLYDTLKTIKVEKDDQLERALEMF